MDRGLRRRVSRGSGLRGLLRRALPALGSALCLAGCGASGAKPSTTPPSVAVAPASQATVRTATCQLWNTFTPRDRDRVVRGLREFFTQRLDTGARERVPPDSRAYVLISRYCRLPFARAFLIYRLYGNAAAFSPIR